MTVPDAGPCAAGSGGTTAILLSGDDSTPGDIFVKLRNDAVLSPLLIK